MPSCLRVKYPGLVANKYVSDPDKATDTEEEKAVVTASGFARVHYGASPRKAQLTERHVS